ncbi:MAG: nitrilase-related carbon-nitrogen hydrolase [Candidatus Lernaella stagnicola]|nr:nitrilase-related carbon-nitrogen hydrolase [Candidatus Lernaella stagnicola]
MKVAAVQFTPEFGQVAENRERAAKWIREADARLTVLPEVAFTGYVFKGPEELAELAEPVNGETFDFMVALAKETGSLLCYGFPESKDGRYYNSAALLGPDGLIAIYRKIHLFMDEIGLFSPGEQPFFVCDVDGLRLGMMICFDWYFPESARSLGLLGAQIILHPANLVLPFCQDAMVTRCLENRVFAVTANRGGSEFRAGREMSFTGRSQVTQPTGRYERLPDTDDGFVATEINLSLADHKQMTARNHLFRDRRPQLYTLGEINK